MRLLKEFKEFAIKGNMIDIAIGVILGTSFNKVVDILVKEVFLPPLLLLTDGAHWEHRKIVLREAGNGAGVERINEVAIGYGKLLEAGVDFLIIGFTVFVIVKMMNSLKKRAEDPDDKTVVTPKDIELLTEIAKSLKVQNELLAKKS